MSNSTNESIEDGHAAASSPDDDLPQVQLFEHCPVVCIEIMKLTLCGSPRSAGEDLEHARVLAYSDGKLPPILVHRRTMQVIDGRHRVRAALLNGRHTIEARLIDCDEATAFVLAVKANIMHGLPLSLSDRKAAAVNIIRSHQHWSDRAVAEATGLSDKTVSAIRSGATAESSQSNARLGKDGRLRPLNTAAMRRQAAELMSDHPEFGLREIARATGLSPATVRDVRKRTDNGEDPVPIRYRNTESGASSPCPATKNQASVKHIDRKELLVKLMHDPSLRFSESGRNVVRWLQHHTVEPESSQIVAADVPNHWAKSVAELARSCADTWFQLAEQLDQRASDDRFAQSG
jgi:ParB-like chromosome segregation protein Spo0J